MIPEIDSCAGQLICDVWVNDSCPVGLDIDPTRLAVKYMGNPAAKGRGKGGRSTGIEVTVISVLFARPYHG